MKPRSAYDKPRRKQCKGRIGVFCPFLNHNITKSATDVLRSSPLQQTIISSRLLLPRRYPRCLLFVGRRPATRVAADNPSGEATLINFYEQRQRRPKNLSRKKLLLSTLFYSLPQSSRFAEAVATKTSPA